MVYRYRASISGNKFFLREYEIRESMTLYSLHLFLQDDLGFAPDQRVMFKGISAGDEVEKEYGLFDFGDGTMDTVTLGQIHSMGLPVVEYLYDMFARRSIRLEFIGEEEEFAKRSYPRLVVEKGRNPDQFSDGYSDFEQLEVGDTLSAEDDESDL